MLISSRHRIGLLDVFFNALHYSYFPLGRNTGPTQKHVRVHFTKCVYILFIQGMLSQISRDQYPCRLSTEKIKLFGAWYERSQVGEEAQDENGSPGNQRSDYPSMQRGRKIVFSPAHEIPLLRSWYENNPKPTTQDLEKCADILNKTEFRKSREAVTARHINTWFKNERARLRREGLLEDLSRPSMAVCPSTSSWRTGRRDLSRERPKPVRPLIWLVNARWVWLTTWSRREHVTCRWLTPHSLQSLLRWVNIRESLGTTSSRGHFLFSILWTSLMFTGELLSEVMTTERKGTWKYM